MADVGLVGFSYAGKSLWSTKFPRDALKSAIIRLQLWKPVLGIVQMGARSFVVADIPGLIEGASEGRGLGQQFLKHIERTHTLLFVIDGLKDDAYDKFTTLRKE
jgi:GTP-binding protein